MKRLPGHAPGSLFHFTGNPIPLESIGIHSRLHASGDALCDSSVVKEKTGQNGRNGWDAFRQADDAQGGGR